MQATRVCRESDLEGIPAMHINVRGNVALVGMFPSRWNEIEYLTEAGHFRLYLYNAEMVRRRVHVDSREVQHRRPRGAARSPGTEAPPDSPGCA